MSVGEILKHVCLLIRVRASAMVDDDEDRRIVRRHVLSIRQTNISGRNIIIITKKLDKFLHFRDCCALVIKY